MGFVAPIAGGGLALPVALGLLVGEFAFHGLVGDRPYTHRAGPGSTIHIPGGVAHSMRNVGTTPGRYLAFHAPTGLEGFFEALGTPIGTTPAAPPDRERLLALARAGGITFLGPAPAAPEAR